MATDVRELAISALLNDSVIASYLDDRIYQVHTVPDDQPRPFMVVEMGTELPITEGWRGGPTQRPMYLIVHDVPGDYVSIDAVLDRAKEVLLSIVPREEFFETRFMSKGQDSVDLKLGTIYRRAQFEWTTST